MNLGLVVIFFLLLVALIALTISAGTRYLESAKKRKASAMLKTAVGGPSVEAKVLIEQEKPVNVWLQQFLLKFNFVRNLEEHIAQAGMTISVSTLAVQMLMTGAVGAFIGWAKVRFISGPAVGAALCGFVAMFLPFLYVRHARNKRMKAFEEQFPEALDFLSRAMRAGHAFSIALEMLSEESPQPLGQEFRKVFNEHNLGLPIETALTNLTTRVPLLDVKFFVSAVLMQRETGGNLSEILTNLAQLIRERFKLKGQVRAASAHGRMTGTILTLMPLVLVVLMTGIAPGYLSSMANDEDGKLIMIAAGFLMIVGHFVVRKIVNIKV